MTKLYGMSTFGWHIRPYTYDMETKQVTNPPDTECATSEDWSLDARTEEGCAEIHRMVSLVVQECRNTGVLS